MELWTASRARAWRQCKKLHWLKYEEGWRHVETPDFFYTGSLWHLAMEEWWGELKDPDERLNDALHVVRGKEKDDWAQIKLEEMIFGYHARWIDEMGDWEVLAVEQEFRGPLYNPDTKRASRTFEMSGKIDVIAKHKPQRRVNVFEHKSTIDNLGNPDTDYWIKLAMDAQVNQYYCGSMMLGFDTWGVMYDVAQKCPLRPKTINSGNKRKVEWTEPEDEFEARKTKAKQPGRIKRKHIKGETDEEWAARAPRPETQAEFRARVADWYKVNLQTAFQRRELPRSEEELVDFLRDCWADTQSVREANNVGSHPRNPDACVNLYGQRCAFYEHCAYGVELAGNANFRRLSWKHPELEEVHETQGSDSDGSDHDA